MDDCMMINESFGEMNEIMRKAHVKALIMILQDVITALPEGIDSNGGNVAVARCYAKVAITWCKQMIGESKDETTSRDMVR